MSAEEHTMTYRGHTCGWFRDEGCLFFAYDAKSGDYMQYDTRALAGLKKMFKDKVDEIEGPKKKVKESEEKPKFNIKWFKQDDVSNLKAWAEVNNFHVDEIVADDKDCLMYASKKFHRDWTKLSEIVLYDKVNEIAYVIYNEGGAVLIGTDEAHKLETWAFRQYDRLKNVLKNGDSSIEG